MFLLLRPKGLLPELPSRMQLNNLQLLFQSPLLMFPSALPPDHL
ncbi:hypothetical protein Tco_1324362, partial [Tanacetum coccineum]